MSSKKMLKKNKYILLGNTGRLSSNTSEHLDFYKYLNLYARVVNIYNVPGI